METSARLGDVANRSFDYIICGGGTSGLTLAVRLTEDPNVTAVVLESGGENIEDLALLRPAQFASQLSNPSLAWTYQTVKQVMTGDTHHVWHRGKGLGGSSGISFMVWTKPPAKEIDDWERLGNTGWNWDRYEKAIRRTEGFVPPSTEVRAKLKLDSDFEKWGVGLDGPVKIAFPGTVNASEHRIRETYQNAGGLHAAEKPLGGNNAGFFFTPNSYDPRTHTRSYATTAFYIPNRHRPNLAVLTHAHVARILPAGNSAAGVYTAQGVEFHLAGQPHVVYCNKDVILCAGALKSPHILELSGIGNPKILNKIGVQTNVALPGVGENVQEHTLVGVSFEFRDDAEYDTVDALADPEVAKVQAELHAKGEGLFTLGITQFAFARLDQVAGSERADEIYAAAAANIRKNSDRYPPGLIKQYDILLDRLKTGAGLEFISFPGNSAHPNLPEKGKRYWSCHTASNHLFSRGTIHARTHDPQDDPDFDPHYFEQEVDKHVWLAAIKFARQLGKTSPLKEMITGELNPGPDVQTDAQLEEWMYKSMQTTWHTVGSCSMLPRDDGGVVDPQLKVYGTTNVRVADLSVVPLHFAAHSMATAYAIAEQAADIIKGSSGR